MSDREPLCFSAFARIHTTVARRKFPQFIQRDWWDPLACYRCHFSPNCRIRTIKQTENYSYMLSYRRRKADLYVLSSINILCLHAFFAVEWTLSNTSTRGRHSESDITPPKRRRMKSVWLKPTWINKYSLTNGQRTLHWSETDEKCPF